ncbi:putative bromodomain associated domain, histone-fold protein [Helianthus annuus]|uniref:Bromodomain associated domain, histone-fold protein n=1 Tax=Helianthus annuus TaxID=4232 RepID=A0A9K3E4Y0_HELAN|nr:uncharacterized protein LOC110912383 [Helianthus annuus]KAF5766114.1 putative bromodomain associated domain, histone-fold protein [Helianthus annuus]KAJ0452546.1 putative bromodomain associated domain, histone-fold protein [Helianthus annuus]KAJ0457483.1 putative bromodomain associated domain, histone-fold protein [Helianthus annuus]KAJ0650009.1 putative bromodomain associated domain, histone-fold protein [Helianthus annuus]KAJ0653793.1 putative bromodomain associated domain, histone-fold p
MNDGGGGESLKDTEPCLKKRRKNDEFAQAIARIAVAQVCESVGFQGFQQSALDTFSDVACKYVREIGKVSSFYADLAGRTECNVFDVVQGLEDLNLSQGFVGASDRDSCLVGSGIVKDLSQFVNLSEEIGFAYSVPSFPVVKERKLTPSFLQAGETPPTDVIPPWLPVCINPKTDTSVPLPNAEETPTTIDGNEQEQKVLDPPPSKLEQLRARNESVFPSVVEQGINPFLSAPLQPGEKEISVISLPAKLKEDDMVQNHSNHVSEPDQSAPTNQAVKNGGCDTEEGGGIVVSKNRPTVQMRFQIGKKSLSTVIRPNEKGKEKVAAWFLNDEVRNENENENEKKTGEVPKVAMDIEEHTANDSVVN